MGVGEVETLGKSLDSGVRSRGTILRQRVETESGLPLLGEVDHFLEVPEDLLRVCA